MQGVSSLRSVVANIDDYKLQTSATVPFKFNGYKLSDDAKAELDKLVDERAERQAVLHRRRRLHGQHRFRGSITRS